MAKLNEKCQYVDINECPYNTRRECPQIKRDCHLPGDDEEHEYAGQPVSWKPIALAVVALTILVIVNFSVPKSAFFKSLFAILSAGSISILAGVLLAWLVDIPRKFDEYTRLISTSLTSYTYLKGLSKEELSELRGRVTAELYMKNAPKLPRGLIKLDNKVCELLGNPFYEVYRETIHCEKPDAYKSITGQDMKISLPGGATQLFVKKNNDQIYTIRNPYAKSQPIKANIGLNNYVYLPKDCRLDDLFKIERFQISIDGGEFIDILPLIKVMYKRHTKMDNLSPDAVTYNTGFHLVTLDNKTINQETLSKVSSPGDAKYEEASGTSKETQLTVSFSDTVRVKLKFSLIVPVDDNHFTKRLKYSTKSYRLDYSIADPDQRLTGQLFGTLIDQSQVEINETDEDRHISIEAFEWLLPKSGAFVVSSKK